MISSEVQRTLVKSPPELWAELSDPAALSRHLGPLGEIRITRAEPEKLVEWEADGASGSVQIKPSAWGTKVTLSARREIEPDEQPAAEAAPAPCDEHLEPGAGSARTSEPGESSAAPPEPSAEGESTAGPEQSPPLEHELTALEEPTPLEEPAIEAITAQTIEQDAATMEPAAEESRRGFFARLFDRLRPKIDGESRLQPASEFGYAFEPDEEAPFEEEGAADLPAEPASEDSQPRPGTAIESLQARFAPVEPAAEGAVAEELVEPIADEAVETAAKEPAAIDAEEPPAASAEPALDMGAELKAAEEVAAEEVTAVLTGVLDRLGAAHHRPFSRA
jgi:hypothetical protein